MSQAGIIAQEYQDAADLFRTLNHSVVTLKKHHFALAGAKHISQLDLEKARQLTVAVLRELVSGLSAESSMPVSNKEIPRVPPFFVERMLQHHKGDLDWYLEDLGRLMEALNKSLSLTEQMIRYLDELCGELDAETASIHRKLWRK